MRNILFVTLSAVTLIGLAGCASAPAKVEPVAAVASCMFPNSREAAPGWVCDEPVAGSAVTAVGSAPKSQAGISFVKQMAAADARVQLAQMMRIQVTNMIKQYAETTGAADQATVDQVNSSVTKQITNETLVGTRLLRSATGPDGTLYVLVGLDEASAQQITEAAIKTSQNNDKAAWQQFRAQKGQDELAADIARQKVEPAAAVPEADKPKN
ncbi:MAG: LPP20 family lipoprotein [Gammaproteobacteria bacterium]|nr:LPP20 family lipoprotein [Gammaproteobacteria bacterium]MBU1775638.1 LPP20 family lipoprotein [Gammaproteobacteria bacterium]MBU1968320.1 LPP20 family lipoprotein [Gammaproteobacteria bacterium]